MYIIEIRGQQHYNDGIIYSGVTPCDAGSRAGVQAVISEYLSAHADADVIGITLVLACNLDLSRIAVAHAHRLLA